MVGDNGNLQNGIDPRIGRRRLLTAGAAALPVIITLRARPAMAEINLIYENEVYRYGDNAGLTSEQVQQEREGGGVPANSSPSGSALDSPIFGGSPSGPIFGSPPGPRR